jgi:hypothetical protein
MLLLFFQSLVNLVGFKQQINTRHRLLRRGRDRSAFARRAPLGQLRLACRQHLHPRDVRWPRRLNLDVREPLWLGGRRTLWRDNDRYSRRYWRVYRHLRSSGSDMCGPEDSRCTSS